ncbi:MarR family transcriptional regulator [Sphingomonas sp. So64.6b]|uniref:MarR family winged helix-turn-helix transcriptional regulator n=1 Tax=Sphingomonas sp. So64.6b TaxID=2997354 RepID=UPI0016046082|nr:MarR family transcriptional regulator [Sphingomonas sp. So64.6b]QNA84019.1 MarR family transcriptional regulator [Sphingomonas sp. So64.6b]
MSDSLGFLISDVSRLMRRRFDERARLIGVTRAQWRTLFIVSRNEGANQGGLADILEVEPITLCRMIDRLEESGLVERRRDPADRRAWQIFITPKARPLLDQLHKIGEDMFAHALDGITQTKRDDLTAALTLIQNNLNDAPKGQEASHG